MISDENLRAWISISDSLNGFPGYVIAFCFDIGRSIFVSHNVALVLALLGMPVGY